LHAARRELARAYVETGDRDNALAALWQALRADPGDTGVILALGRLRLEDSGRETAERLARLALEREPSNPEALGASGRALLLDPQLPGPRLGAARALLRQGHGEESQARLEELFGQVGQKGHPASVLTPARELYVETQEHLTRRDLEKMRQVVEDFRRRLEEQHGVPIRVVDFEEKDHGWVQVAWTHGRDHHLVGGPPSLPEPVRLHLLAQQLLRVQLESEAYRAGKLREFTPGAAQGPRFRGLCSGVAHDLRRQGFPPHVIAQALQGGLEFVRDCLCNLPLDLLVETRLRAQLPILAPAQFLALRHLIAGSRGLDENAEMRRVLPRPLWLAALAMDGAFRVFWDERFGGATEFAARSRTLPTFELSLRLVRQWEASSAQLRPGDHYRLVDGFASLLGLEGLYEARECLLEHQGAGEQAFSA
jgi:hypothetical protein